ncbi:MAG: non-ribosomal peptide synthetase, partial [Natronosporangium sp.]
VLVRLAGDDHVLGLLIHHIVFDGWSAEILTRELAELYQAYRAGRSSPLPPLPIGYGDFAAWQRRTVEQRGAADAGYWVQRLAGVPQLALPTDRPYPDRQSFSGGWHRFWLDPELTAAVADLAWAHRATPFMTLQAAFQALLGWYCGQSDFAIGTPVSGRDRTEIEPLVGLFLNTVAIRADLSGDPSFAELLRRVRAEAVQAYAHQGLPFEQVVAQLRLSRDPRRSSVFQVLFDLQGWPRPDPRDPPAGLGGGLTMTRFEAHNPATRHELALHLAPVGDRLEGYLTYSADLFDPATVERLCQRYVTILRQVTADPTRRLSGLDLLTGPERAQVLAWGDGGPVRMDRMPATLGGVLDRTLASTPDAPAVVQDGQVLTYRELDQRANRLARHLRRLGVEPDARVGICLPPSFDQAVAVLAVLRAGGAYLPLDPEQPPARLAFLLADAGAAVLVTDAGLARRVPDYPGRVVAVDADAAAIGSAGTEPLPVTVGPEQLAYVIYTSGSTGVPKGVAVEHGPVLRYLAAVRDRLQLPTGARFGLLQSLAYDFSVTMFYLPLLTGGCVHLIPRRSTGEQLAGYLAAERIDYLKLTPSHLAALAGEVAAGRLLPRRALLLGGEAFGADLAHRLAAAAADSTAAIYTHYG